MGLTRVDKGRARSRAAKRFPNILLFLKERRPSRMHAAHAGGKLQSPIGRSAMTRAHNLHLFCRPGRVRSISE